MDIIIIYPVLTCNSEFLCSKLFVRCIISTSLKYCFLLEFTVLLHKQHKLSRQKFNIEVVAEQRHLESSDKDCIIEVSGFKSSVSKDILEMYFESKKSGGKDEAVKNCSMVCEGTARLTFHDPEGVLNVCIFILNACRP